MHRVTWWWMPRQVLPSKWSSPTSPLSSWLSRRLQSASRLISRTRGAISLRAQYLRDRAQNVLDVQRDHMRETNSVIRGVSSWWGNAELPAETVYLGPIQRAEALWQALQDLDNGNVLTTAQRLASLAQELARLADDVGAVERAWHRYINATIEGAEGVTHGLEITRDVSFWVAAGIGAVVALPVVAGSAVVTSTLGTGALATLGAGGAVVAGGAATGAVLRGGSSVAGQALAGHVDWSEAGAEAGQGVRRGAVDAAVGLVAPGISAGATRLGVAGLTRSFGREVVTTTSTALSRNALGRFTLRAAQHVPGASLVGGLHAGLTEATTGHMGDLPPAVARGMLGGAMFGLGGAALGPLFQRLFRILPSSFSFRPRTTVYHGTTPEGASAIRSTGPAVRGGLNDDFGPGFYTSRNPQTARDVATRFEDFEPEVMAIPLPLRRPFLDLTRGRWREAWERFLDQPYIPGGLSRRVAFFELRTGDAGGRVIPAPDPRFELLQLFIRENNIPLPLTMVEGPLPQYAPGSMQIAIYDPQVLEMIREALRYQPPNVVAYVEGLLSSLLSRPDVQPAQ